MQKLIIKNLGPIKNCEMEVRPFTIFIGESGSGKSILLRTISMLKWVYKKMQYKNLLKASGVKSDTIRLSLDKISRDAMLDDYLTKDSYIEFQINNQTIIIIENKKLKPSYKNISTTNFLLGKIVFLNENRTALPEILSTSGGRKAKFSYYTDDMIENFYEAFDEIGENFQLNTMDIKLHSEKMFHRQFFINRNGKKIKLEHASSGEKNASILELISYYFSNKYDFGKGFNKNLNLLLTNNSLLDDDETVKLTLLVLLDYLSKIKVERLLSLFIEEPESNLFPTNQRDLTYFLSSLRQIKNIKNNIEIIFSTHSPYILMVVDSLLYAYELSQKNKDNKELQEKISQIIPKQYHLNIEDLSAYVVKNGVVESIIDPETNLINSEYIDTVSYEIMDHFNQLCELDRQ